MSGELKVDIISSSTNGEDIEIDGNLQVNKISPNEELIIDGSLRVLGTIMGTLDTFLPVGSILPFDKSFPNMPELTGPFVECNGQLIEDSESVFKGYRTRNLNGAEVHINLTWHPDSGGCYTTVNETDITALSVGDNVIGVGIAEDSYVKEIRGTTVVISEIAMVEETPVHTVFTNDGDFIRGGLGSGVGQKDSFQGHWHEQYIRLYSTFSGGGGGDLDRLDATNTFKERQNSDTGIRDPKTDGVNSIPRTSHETRPVNKSMVYIMRIK